jgi:hypothetical protein
VELAERLGENRLESLELIRLARIEAGFAAAALSANGVSAFSAWLILLHRSVRS